MSRRPPELPEPADHLCDIAAGVRKRIRTLEKELLHLRQLHSNCVWAMQHFSIESYEDD